MWEAREGKRARARTAREWRTRRRCGDAPCTSGSASTTWSRAPTVGWTERYARGEFEADPAAVARELMATDFVYRTTLYGEIIEENAWAVAGRPATRVRPELDRHLAGGAILRPHRPGSCSCCFTPGNPSPCLAAHVPPISDSISSFVNFFSPG